MTTRGARSPRYTAVYQDTLLAMPESTARPFSSRAGPRRRGLLAPRASSSGRASSATTRSRSAVRWRRPGCSRMTCARRPRRSGGRPKPGSGSIRPGCPTSGGCTAGGGGARRAVPRRRVPDQGAETGRARPRFALHRPLPLRARGCATGRSATWPSSASTSPPPPPRCTPPATGGTSRWCTRSPACRWRRKAGSRRRWSRCVMPSGWRVVVAGRRRAGDGLRQSGERRADAAPPRSGAGARRAQRRAAGGVRHAARARRRAGVARADLRAGRQSEARGGGAQPRARRPQPAAVHARDDRRRVRHARADPPDPRRARRGQPRLQKAREAYGEYGAQTAAGISGRCACSKRVWRCAAGSRGGRSTMAADVARSGGIPASTRSRRS